MIRHPRHYPRQERRRGHQARARAVRARVQGDRGYTGHGQLARRAQDARRQRPRGRGCGCRWAWVATGVPVPVACGRHSGWRVLRSPRGRPTTLWRCCLARSGLRLRHRPTGTRSARTALATSKSTAKVHAHVARGACHVFTAVARCRGPASPTSTWTDTPEPPFARTSAPLAPREGRTFSTQDGEGEGASLGHGHQSGTAPRRRRGRPRGTRGHRS